MEGSTLRTNSLKLGGSGRRGKSTSIVDVGRPNGHLQDILGELEGALNADYNEANTMWDGLTFGGLDHAKDTEGPSLIEKDHSPHCEEGEEHSSLECEMRNFFTDPNCQFVVFEVLSIPNDVADMETVNSLECQVKALQEEITMLRTQLREAIQQQQKLANQCSHLKPDTVKSDTGQAPNLQRAVDLVLHEATVEGSNTLQEELQKVRQELDAQRSQASLQIIQLRREYDAKLSEVALQQERLKRREAELAKIDDKEAVIAELEADLQTERAECRRLQKEVAVLRATAQPAEDKDRELQRLRTIMRFSQLKKDSDELHMMQSRIQDLELQVQRLKDTHRGKELELERLRAVEFAFEDFQRASAARVVAQSEVERPVLRNRQVVSEGSIFNASPFTTGSVRGSLPRPSLPLVDKRVRSASSQGPRRISTSMITKRPSTSVRCRSPERQPG